ncbi:unnamed protein product, partial [Prunus brigantina]
MEKCLDKSKGEHLKWSKSIRRDHTSTNVVRCHGVRQKKFCAFPMLGSCEGLFEIQ